MDDRKEGEQTMHDIQIITTGGTFDKLYDAIRGELTFRESQIPDILRKSRTTLSIGLENAVAVDSLFMTPDQRRKIVDQIISSNEKKIVVIHGTDTMVDTAKLLASDGRFCDKTVVFTGAMIPHSLENSDSEFNLGVAIGAIQLLETGIYIAMCGRIFDYNNVRKNREKGIFEEICQQ